MFRDGREFDDDNLDEIAKEILQEKEVKLLSESERDEIVREYNQEFAAKRNKTQAVPVETDTSEVTKKYPINMWAPEIDG